MADPYPIRLATEDEYAAFHAVTGHAFATGPLREGPRRPLAAPRSGDLVPAHFLNPSGAG
jgi:hypothetical protein